MWLQLTRKNDEKQLINMDNIIVINVNGNNETYMRAVDMGRIYVQETIPHIQEMIKNYER